MENWYWRSISKEKYITVPWTGGLSYNLTGIACTVAKSVTSILAGLPVEKGFISGTQEKVYEISPNMRIRAIL